MVRESYSPTPTEDCRRGSPLKLSGPPVVSPGEVRLPAGVVSVPPVRRPSDASVASSKGSPTFRVPRGVYGSLSLRPRRSF